MFLDYGCAMAVNRPEISLRLKSARYLRGRVIEGRAVALSPAELAEADALKVNGITKSRIEEIEQMRVDAREMELEKIALALSLPSWWFSAPYVPVLTDRDREYIRGEQRVAEGGRSMWSEGEYHAGGHASDREENERSADEATHRLEAKLDAVLDLLTPDAAGGPLPPADALTTDQQGAGTARRPRGRRAS